MPDRTLPTAGRAPAALPSLRVRLLGGFQVLSVNGVTVPALSSPTGVGDYDGDNVADMMAKCDRQAMVSALGSTTGDVTMVVSGQLTDGRRCRQRHGDSDSETEQEVI